MLVWRSSELAVHHNTSFEPDIKVFVELYMARTVATDIHTILQCLPIIVNVVVEVLIVPTSRACIGILASPVALSPTVSAAGTFHVTSRTHLCDSSVAAPVREVWIGCDKEKSSVLEQGLGDA